MKDFKTIKFKTDDGQEVIASLEARRYVDNDTLAIVIMQGDEPWGNLTVNVVDKPFDNDNLVTLDTNNLSFCDVVKVLEDEGIIKRQGYCIQSGWCDYPVYLVTDKINEYTEIPKKALRGVEENEVILKVISQNKLTEIEVLMHADEEKKEVIEEFKSLIKEHKELLACDGHSRTIARLEEIALMVAKRLSDKGSLNTFKMIGIFGYSEDLLRKAMDELDKEKVEDANNQS